MSVSSGIAMEIHYCMGKKSGVAYYQTGTDKCGKCGMKENKKGCCHEEHQFHKLEDAHKKVNNDFVYEAPVTIFHTCLALYNWQILSHNPSLSPRDNSPPVYIPSSCRIMNCIFRI